MQRLDPEAAIQAYVFQYFLVMLVLGVWAARRHNVRSHKFTMIGIFFGALLIAGLFTLMPGRIMHAVIFGN